MREYKEYEEILELWQSGINKKTIASVTGIPRTTVRDCINRFGTVAGLQQQYEQATRSTPDTLLMQIQDADNAPVQQAYAYLLGLYLGDGDLSEYQRVYRLRIALDKKYPGIIRACMDAVGIILPDNQVSTVDSEGCVYVSCYHKFWPELFPQHGVGRKHQRDIRLEPWQQQIVDRYALEFFRGLYHSDGSRSSNIVNGRDYPRYSFTNRSAQLCQLFWETCNRLNIHWTIKYRKSPTDQAIDVFIARRRDVHYLDSVIGPKS